ncbi:unnamed protein product [Phaedon cochleariae]|uniref:Cuticle protein n=1 Tax=Phaedon cochleariae TaxID=80249 RepID=A0A9P0GPU8_PHACE|nr:unnamed protein product [Phaedon cochleariae]
MFKLVVLSALVALAVAKPSGLLHTSVVAPAIAYSAPIAVPAAVSHSYRSDVINRPIVAAYSAPILENVVAPVHLPSAVSHSYRSDVVSSPVVASAYAAPWAYAAHVPSIHAW